MDHDAHHNVEKLLETPELIEAIESRQFRYLLDRIPIALAVASMMVGERIIYANSQFEKLTGLAFPEINGKPWSVLKGKGEHDGRDLARAIADANDNAGVFHIERPGKGQALVDVYSNIIETEEGAPDFRLVAFLDVTPYLQSEREKFKQSIQEKDLLLRELQHRVKNNLQMITALIRLEARNLPTGAEKVVLDRIAGRIEALQILYTFLAQDHREEVDLGSYLSQIASAVIRTQGLDGIRLNLKTDVCPVSVNIAMPAGLIVNELLTNALKHAFAGRKSGTLTLHCVNEDSGYEVVVADDGVGFPPGVEWPRQGSLGGLIVQSLQENAKAELTIDTRPGRGTRAVLKFTRPSSVQRAKSKDMGESSGKRGHAH